jgi:branched-chain amino acid transport system substrate-binding protein
MQHGRFVIRCFCTLLLGLFGTRLWAEQPAMKIGVQVPLSGERAPVGRLIKNSVDMAVEAVNQKGGIHGMPLAVVYEDDQNTEQGAVEAAKKLAHDPQVMAIIGELFSRFVMASRDLVEEQGVPYLTGGTSPRTTENAKWIFRVGASDTLLAHLIARYVVEELKLQKLAVLHDSTGIHNARAEAVVKSLQEKYGVAPLVRESWKPGEKDFTPQLGKAQASAVQAIIALGETGEGGPFLKQVKARGIEALIVAHRDFGVKKVFEEAGEAANGVLIITEYVPALQEPERQAWALEYQQRYGTEASVIAAQYFDAVLLLAEAAKTGGTRREGIKTGLEQLKGFRGVLADYSFDEQKNGVHRLYVAKIEGGKPTLATLLEEK